MAGVTETYTEDVAKRGTSPEVTQARPPRGVAQWFLKGHVSGDRTEKTPRAVA